MDVFKVDSNAEIPAFATAGSACFDLKACFSAGSKVRAYNPHNREMEIPVKQASDGRLYITLHPQFRTLVPTGLIFDIPEKHVLKIFIRSSMALKFALRLANDVGIIDSDYVDPTYMMIINDGDTPITIYSGDRLCQGRLEKNAAVYALKETLEKPGQKTDREGGLGSTGI